MAALERSVAAATALGARRETVVRTRILLVPGVDWAEAARAHREMLEGVDPANTTYFVAGLVPADALVEVELEAAVWQSPTPP